MRTRTFCCYANVAVLPTAEDFAEMTTPYLRRARGAGVRHAEVLHNPQLYIERGVPLREVRDGVASRLADSIGEHGLSRHRRPRAGAVAVSFRTRRSMGRLAAGRWCAGVVALCHARCVAAVGRARGRAQPCTALFGRGPLRRAGVWWSKRVVGLKLRNSFHPARWAPPSLWMRPRPPGRNLLDVVVESREARGVRSLLRVAHAVT
jgi:hypothetical protein